MKGTRRYSQSALSRALLWGSIVALASIGPVRPNPGAPESGQNPPSVTVTTPVTIVGGVFDPDLADVKPQPLTNAINQLKSQAKCRPPRITFKVLVPSSKDPDFANKLAAARADALKQWLGASKVLEPDQYNPEVTAEVTPDTDEVEFNFAQFNDQDRDPPKLKVNWDPVPGTPVKEGDQIKVKIVASERYEDGHKSWPTGVQSIQLIANGAVQEPSGNYRPPQQCERRTLDVAYKVPNDAPGIVHLEAYTEDGAGNNDSETADYPTGDWYGTLREHSQGNVYNDTVTIIFSFSEKSGGTIEGTGRVSKVTSEPQVFGRPCTYMRKYNPPRDSFSISGQRVGDEFHIELPANYRLKGRLWTTDCPGAPTETQRSLGKSETTMRPKVQVHDGAKDSFHASRPVEIDASIELHRNPWK
jgi:hypothetical protein